MKAADRDRLVEEFFNSKKGGALGRPYFRMEFKEELKALKPAERLELAREIRAHLQEQVVQN